MNVIEQVMDALEEASVYIGLMAAIQPGRRVQELAIQVAASRAAMGRYEVVVVEGAAVPKNGEWRVTPDNPFGLERPAILLVEREP